ncbi:outer membrane protein transport protein [Sulfitobacter sp. D35]|uniref:OmpP1/FadL family transporter n=1 Tax=Sulfitobacter sp. D35 TaxID=3083252 RepID=UPI00296FDC0D|nr:outer membrane protein transport protein [Sulfitobacter sp. D35]MDW4497768.1 outer membrane protein transport protein [Sulfitobacter sp. D35]
MKSLYTSAAALAFGATAAHAGAIDRSGQSVAVLFEEGRYVEFSLGSINPDVSGTGSVLLGGGESGDMAPSYLQFGAAYKADINDQWSYALIYDQPFGADVDYPGGTGYFAQGSTAELDSHALTGILRYKMPSNVSFYGGIRAQSLEAKSNIPFVAGYTGEGDRDWGVGYLAGVAYERPDIALRISLTYNSEITHKLDTTESSLVLGGPNTSVTEVDTPQSVNLEFQTGIAEDTLLFGGVRWADWSDFDITPADYQTLTGGSLVSYNDDVYTWSLGVGRRINDNWSVAASVGYEEQNGGFFTNLGPTDGMTSVGLSAVYTEGNMKITSGVRYSWIGDTETRAGAVEPAGTFDGNDAIGFGVKVGYTF